MHCVLYITLIVHDSLDLWSIDRFLKTRRVEITTLKSSPQNNFSQICCSTWGSSSLKISNIGLISKEGETVAKNFAKQAAKILIGHGVGVVSFPDLHMKGVQHVSRVKELGKSNIDLLMTFSGDGTILRLLRLLNSTTPCLCVNVGGRGILAEIKPDQIQKAIAKIMKGEFSVEQRLRILPSVNGHKLPPALNEVLLIRKSFAKAPTFTIDFGKGAVFSQRMDGLMITTPTGSTGHSYSYGSPFAEGSLEVFLLTPLGPILRFPRIILPPTKIKVTANYALQLVIDGQDTLGVEAGVTTSFVRHEKSAAFVRFDSTGPYRQLKNMGFS